MIKFPLANWRYLLSALVFAGGIVLVAFGWHICHFNAIACFWIAYILSNQGGW
ncbi:hypothetical protein [Pantoea sp. BAV 3049]|uniref:hypothetical protein n=1 Tax=Pantoea sp. BAV 3049 TaxID=2654188 RepID=UPI001E57FEB9|nr:hypothetical protein [Pantoea sp. BAV 3049]